MLLDLAIIVTIFPFIAFKTLNPAESLITQSIKALVNLGKRLTLSQTPKFIVSKFF